MYPLSSPSNPPTCLSGSPSSPLYLHTLPGGSLAVSISCTMLLFEVGAVCVRYEYYHVLFFPSCHFLTNTAIDGENYLLHSLLLPNDLKRACQPHAIVNISYICVPYLVAAGVAAYQAGATGWVLLGRLSFPALMKRCRGSPRRSFSSPGLWTEVSMLPG